MHQVGLPSPSVSGGDDIGKGNEARGNYASVSGGHYNTASGTFSAVSGGSQRAVTGTYNWRAGNLSAGR